MAKETIYIHIYIYTTAARNWAKKSPNSIMSTFTKTYPRGKLQTHIMKVADANSDKSRNREVSVKVADTNPLDMSRCLRQIPWQVHDKPVCVTLTEFRPLQCTRKVGNKVCRLCCGHKSWKLASRFVSRTFMICRGLCHKVSVMEFGLKKGIRLNWAWLSICKWTE